MSESFEIPAEFGWRCGTEIKMTFDYTKSMEKELLWAIERVNELHKKIPGPYDDYVCDHCSRLTVFASDVIPYPCPTIQALEGN